jgi:hypothetical protein
LKIDLAAHPGCTSPADEGVGAQICRQRGEIMIRAWCSSLRVQLLLLILIAIIPTAGLSLYTSLEDRRGAARAVRQDTLTGGANAC